MKLKVLVGSGHIITLTRLVPGGRASILNIMSHPGSVSAVRHWSSRRFLLPC